MQGFFYIERTISENLATAKENFFAVAVLSFAQRAKYERVCGTCHFQQSRNRLFADCRNANRKAQKNTKTACVVCGFARRGGRHAVSACACWRSNCSEDMSCADYDVDFRYLLAIQEKMHKFPKE